jgi:chromosome segregation ATPase
MALKEHVEGQLRTAHDKFKHKRRDLRMKEQEREEEDAKNADIQASLIPKKRELRTLDGDLQNVERELADQDAKLKRAQDQARKIVESFRNKAGDAGNETVRWRPSNYTLLS